MAGADTLADAPCSFQDPRLLSPYRDTGPTHLAQLQPLGHGLQTLLPRALHRQGAFNDIAVQQADPRNKAVLAQDVVAPSPTKLQAERHGSAAGRGTPPSSPGTGTP